MSLEQCWQRYMEQVEIALHYDKVGRIEKLNTVSKGGVCQMILCDEIPVV